MPTGTDILTQGYGAGAPAPGGAGVSDSILDWDDLTHTATALAEGPPARTALGGLAPNWQTLTAGFACLVQQHVALRRSIEQTGADEGLQVRHTHVLYCRRNRSRADATLVQLAEAGRVSVIASPLTKRPPRLSK